MTRATSRPWSAGSLLAFTLALGVTTGLLHLVVYAVRRVVLDEFTWMPRSIVWMAPVAYAVYFGGLGFALAALHWRWPAFWSGRRLLFAPFALAVATLLLLSSGIHPLAQLVLALGAGSFLASFADSRQQALRDRLRWWLGIAVLLVVLLGTGEPLWRAVRERRALASVAPADASRPNVLLLILDTVRARNLSLYGYARATTPVLDSLASSSIVFDAAFSPSSWTLPSHGSMFTGRTPFELNAAWNAPLDGRHPALAEHFQSGGYATGGFVANLLYTTYESGLSRGFQHYDDYRTSPRQILLTSSPFRNRLTHDILTARSWAELRDAMGGFVRTQVRRNANNDRKRAPEVFAEFLDWQATRDRPFFAFLNFFDAHEPYDAPGPWRSNPASGPTSEDYYDGAIARLDAQIGILLDSLRSRGVLDNTILVVTADHGEQFGEHGLESHGNSLYTQVVHVPLVVLLPNAEGAGRRVRDAVSLTDLGRTLLELANVDGADFPGRSLLPLVRDPAASGFPVTSEERGLGDIEPRDPTFFGPMRAVFSGDWHLIRRGDGRQELYNFREDPDEVVDLVSSAVHADARDSMSTLLDRVH